MSETVEISKEQLAVLQRSYNFMNGLFTGEHSLDFKRLIKKADPDGKVVKVPDIDLADKIAAPINEDLKKANEQIAALQKRLDDGEKSAKDEKALSDIHKKIDEVAKARGLTEDGKKGLIETMQKRQIADPEAAALLYLDSLPKTKPSSAADSGRKYLPQKFDQYNNGLEPMQGKDDETVKRFFADPLHAMDQEVAAILNEEAA